MSALAVLIGRMEYRAESIGLSWAAVALQIGVTPRTVLNWRLWKETRGQKGSKPTGAAEAALRRWLDPEPQRIL